MASCLLYHGPGARSSAVKEANRAGTPISPPIGEDGLKVDDAREVINLMNNIPLGIARGTLVVGPMDLAPPKSSDVLLKSIEEFDGDCVLPILWAHDISGVAFTIRSRCMERWSDTTEDELNQDLVDAGYEVVDALIERELYKIPMIVKKFSKKEHDLIGVITDALSSLISHKECQIIWERLRQVALLKNPTDTEIISALIGGYPFD